MINSSGQTALEIAQFWNQGQVVDILGGVTAHPLHPSGRTVSNFFAGNTLNRHAEKRKDDQWLSENLKADCTVIILMHNLCPVVKRLPDTTTQGLDSQYRVLRTRYSQLQIAFDGHEPLVVFLGIEESSTPWFALDVSHVPVSQLKEIDPHAVPSEHFYAMLSFKNFEAAVCGQARSLLAWHDRYQFCPTCGSRTDSKDAGYRRACQDKGCRSHKGCTFSVKVSAILILRLFSFFAGTHNTCYPRLDPTVIMAVVSSDGKQVLLGRGKKFPPHFYSCLAGFVEPGE
jgi:NAD+ diphosphatase